MVTICCKDISMSINNQPRRSQQNGISFLYWQKVEGRGHWMNSECVGELFFPGNKNYVYKTRHTVQNILLNCDTGACKCFL